MKSFIFSLSMFFLASAAGAASDSSETLVRRALASGAPVMVDFGGESCRVCRDMKPILDQARREYQGKAQVLFVDVWKEPDMGKKYRIQLIPTQIFYDVKGQEVKRHVGFLDRQGIAKILAELGIK